MGERFHIGHFERAFERQQFGAMKLGELRKALLALFQEPYFNSAPVLRANVAPHKTHFFASCYERHDPVMLGL